MRLAAMKELSVQWMEEAYHYINDSKCIIVNGFRKSGIFDAVDSSLSLTPESDMESNNPFTDRD